MDIIVSARHMDHVSQAMRIEAEDRLQSMASKYPKLTKAEVVMDKTKKGCYAEIVLHGKGIDLESKSDEQSNLYDAIHQSADRIEKQLDKKFGRKRRHNSKHLGELEVEILSINYDASDDFDTIEEYQKAL